MFDTNREVVDQEALSAEIKANSQTKLSPFDFVNAINQKKHLDLTDEVIEKQYDPFIINRAFLQNEGTVNLAAFMDQNYFLDKRLQFEFYFHIIPKNNSYGKWAKANTDMDEKIEVLKKLFSYSRAKCIEVIPFISDDEWGVFKKRISIGGKTK